MFETGKPKRTICLFCKDKNLNEAALAAGAEAAMGLEGLKMFQVRVSIMQSNVHLVETLFACKVNLV